jgi:hypothetical protein
MKYVRWGEDQKTHVQPKHTGRTLCGDRRDIKVAIVVEGPATCQWCIESEEAFNAQQRIWGEPL